MAEYIISFQHRGEETENMVILPSEWKLLGWIREHARKCDVVCIRRVGE